jgi:low temperature requirement protein LtrA
MPRFCQSSQVICPGDRTVNRKPAARRNPDEEHRVSTLELFFDLVFVFAITQISHLLLEHLDWRGVLESVMVLLFVWWAWNYSTWANNELDPKPHAGAVPAADHHDGQSVAGGCDPRDLRRQGPALCTLLSLHSHLPAELPHVRGSGARHRRAEPVGYILTWFFFVAPFWVAGALVEGDSRIFFWLIALAIDYAGPFAIYFVPWLKKLDPDAWVVGSGHFAERFQLFTIIALSETVVLTGATASGLDFTLPVALAFTAAFVSTACLWWLYFNYMATILERVLDEADTGPQSAETFSLMVTFRSSRG